MSDESIETSDDLEVTESPGEVEEAPQPAPVKEAAPAPPPRAPDYVRDVLRARPTEPTRTSTPAPVPPVGRPSITPEIKWPTQDDWLNDPGRAAEMERAATRQYNDQATGNLRSENQALQQRLEAIERSQQTSMQKRVSSAIVRTERNIDLMYEKMFSQSEHFNNNPAFQKMTNELVKRYTEIAVYDAHETGDTDRLDELADPKIAIRFLKLVESEFPNLSSSPLPLRVQGGYQASGTSSPPSSGGETFTAEEMREMKEHGLSPDRVAKARANMGKRS